MRELPRWFVRRLFFLRIGKGDAEQVQETLDWGADPNWRTKRETPAIVRAVRGMDPEPAVVRVLLAAGADPNAADATGLTALDHVRRRLLKYDGKPRRKQLRSRSLTPGGELRLREEEWEFIEELKAADPARANKTEEMYLRERRKVAERVFDPRGKLDVILSILEPLSAE